MIPIPEPIKRALLGIVAALAFVAALFGWGRSKKRQGAAEAAVKAQREDFENAQDIRRRVSDDRAERVRSLDDAGYRD